MFTVGIMYITAQGEISRNAPTVFNPASVKPSCADLITITSLYEDVGERLSNISLRYGVLSVRHLPGSALDSLDRYLFSSAHCETVSKGIGFNPSIKAAIKS